MITETQYAARMAAKTTVDYEAEEELDRLRESNADLVEALKPFAHVAGFFENADDDTSITVYAAGSHRGNERDPWQEKLTVGDCRSARDAIIRALDTEHEAE